MRMVQFLSVLALCWLVADAPAQRWGRGGCGPVGVSKKKTVKKKVAKKKESAKAPERKKGTCDGDCSPEGTRICNGS